MGTSTVRDFIGLQATEDPSAWRLDVTEQALTPAGMMQGGALFAAAVEAMEGTVGRPLVWATGQYLSHLAHPARAQVTVDVAVAGRRTTQVRAVIRHEDTDVITAIGALGTRPFAHNGTWVTPPAVAPPRDCPARPIPGVADGIAVCEVRAALGRSYPDVDGSPGSGRSASWVRLPGNGCRIPTVGDLAVIGDFVMLEASDALGVAVTGNSLDNTVRVARPCETEWVLVDATIHAVAGGFCHTTADLWSEDGTLLGTGSQTLVLRELGPGGSLPERVRRVTGGGAP